MAGGKNAEYVVCTKCAGKAKRTSEGIETDWYECTECGKKFGITWQEPPEEPYRHPTKEESDMIKEAYKKLHDK